MDGGSAAGASTAVPITAASAKVRPGPIVLQSAGPIRQGVFICGGVRWSRQLSPGSSSNPGMAPKPAKCQTIGSVKTEGDLQSALRVVKNMPKRKHLGLEVRVRRCCAAAAWGQGAPNSPTHLLEFYDLCPQAHSRGRHSSTAGLKISRLKSGLLRSITQPAKPLWKHSR